MMKYIEELDLGEIFLYSENGFIKTTDFKQTKNGIQYLCVRISDGKPNWLEGNTAVNILDLYKRDNDGNILPLKNYKSDSQDIAKA